MNAAKLKTDLAALGFNTNNVVVLDGGIFSQIHEKYNGNVLFHNVPGVTRTVAGLAVTAKLLANKRR